MNNKIILGIDVGASGIKGALVNTKTGKLVTERYRVPTPQPSTPKKMAKAFKEIVEYFNWSDVIGCGFPAIIKNGVVRSAANIDKSWIGVDAKTLLSKASGSEVYICNDADAAGVAEMKFGAGTNSTGTVIIITVGSGLGSSVFIDGNMIPNTELGHLYLKGHNKIAERYAADSVRKSEELKWKTWGKRFNQYLQHLELLFSPDLILLGGGGSKKFEQFSDCLKLKTPVIPAQLLNYAGIIGAGVYAFEKLEVSTKATY